MPIIITTAIIALVIGFVGGITYQKSKQPSFSNRGNQQTMGQPGASGTNQNSNARGANTPTGNRPVTGQIASIDGSSLTVTSSDGSSKIVVISSSTTVSQLITGSVSDLQSGENITVMGTQNSDGSITAQSISFGGTANNFGPPAGGPDTPPAH